MDRRQFLHRTSVGSLAALTASVQPLWSYAASLTTSPRKFVVLQLSGGNDGLNTVIPYHDDVYYQNRLTLAYGRDELLRIDDRIGLHPSLTELASLLDKGMLTLLQGVGYPNPNRSHFESMDLWHTAHAANRNTGWLGRYLDRAKQTTQPSAIYVGNGVRPLALQARSSTPLSVRQIDQFRIGSDTSRPVAEEVSRVQADDDDLTALVAKNLTAALQADAQLAAVTSAASNVSYPESQLGQDLKTVAAMIRAEIPAAVYYVTLDGFDTHANQRNAHSALLQQFSAALSAFCKDLSADQLLDQVLVMAFSEFGRRVKENGSLGTDHGVAGPLFLAGGGLQGGIVGDHPSLTDLDDGDLKVSLDYRRIYNAVLQDWMELPAGQHPKDTIILGEYPALPNLFRV
jgi:uncharacterized protein (DUF1501 family)